MQQNATIAVKGLKKQTSLCDFNLSFQQDKLVSIISGLLRQKHFQFVDTYKEEAVTTVRAVTKQRVIEALAASDCCSDQQAAGLEVGGLSLAERLTLLQNTIQSLTHLLYRVKVGKNQNFVISLKFFKLKKKI